MDVEGDHIDYEFITTANDAIEVYIPKQIQQDIENIRQYERDRKIMVMQLKSELMEARSGARDNKKEKIEKIQKKNVLNELSLIENNSVKENLDRKAYEKGKMELNDDHLMILQKQKFVYDKNVDFQDKILDEISRCKKINGYRYYVIFLHFQSYNVTEMSELDLYNENFKHSSELANNGGGMNPLEPDVPEKVPFDGEEMFDQGNLLIQVKADMYIDTIIEVLDEALTEKLRAVKEKNVIGNPDNESCLWMIIYFHSHFYLGEVALEQLVKFLDEVHWKEGIRFALFFKKIEDTVVYPAGQHTLVRDLKYDKENNMFSNFLLSQLLNSNYLNSPARIMSPDVISRILYDYYQSRTSLSCAIDKVRRIFKIHKSLHPPKEPTAAELKKVVSLRRDFKCSLRLLQDFLLYRGRHLDLTHDDLLMMYCNENISTLKKAISEFDISLRPDLLLPLTYGFEKISRMSRDPTKVVDLEDLEILCAELVDVLRASMPAKEDQAHKFKELLEMSIKETENIKGRIKVKNISNQLKENRSKKDQVNKENSKPEITYKNKDDRGKAILYGSDKFKEGHLDEIEKYSTEIEKVFRNIYSHTIDFYLNYLRTYHAHLVIDNVEEFWVLVHPDIMGSYAHQLAKLQKSCKNPVEIAEKILFEIVVLDEQTVTAERLFVSFRLRFEQSFKMFDQEMVKNLFYYAINSLKRAGLLSEKSKIKKILTKSIYRKREC
jgi:hypothetical protein